MVQSVFATIKPYRRTIKKAEDVAENVKASIQNNIITGGGVTDTFDVIEDIKPKKRPIKPKQTEPTTKKEKLDYFIKFKFT